MKGQKILLSVTALAIAGSTLFAVPNVYAQSPTPAVHMNFFQELIQFISQKFGLDKTVVQTAVKDFQQQKRANITPRPTLTPQQLADREKQMTDREKTRLDQLIKDGKITSAQETAIIAEQATLRTKYNLGTMKTASPTDRKTQMDAMRDEVVAWAKSQGIDSSYVMPGFGGMGGRGFDGDDNGKGMGRGGIGWGMMNTTVTPAPAQ